MPGVEDLILEAAGRLLGLPFGRGDEAPISIEAVVPLDHPGWAIQLGGRKVPAGSIIVEPADQADRYLHRTRHLALSIQGDSNDPVMKGVVARLSERLKSATWDRVDWWLGGRFEDQRKREPHETPTISSTGKLCRGMHITWNHPRGWSRYFADEEFQQSLDGFIRFDMDSCRVEHGDMECQFVSTRGFTCKQWEIPHYAQDRCRTWERERLVRRRALPGKPESGEGGTDPETGVDADSRRGRPSFGLNRNLSTNLLDIDVIEGATPRLEELLESVRQSVEPDFLMVNCTCVPQVVGDDVSNVVEREMKEADYPILYKDQSTGVNPFDRNAAIMRKAFQDAARVDRDPDTINLVGFRKGPDRSELVSFLEHMGITVHQMMVPEVATWMAEGYLRAGVQVLYPDKALASFNDRLFKDIDILSITPPAPFGFAMTRDFFQAIARALSREDLADRIRVEAEAWHEAHWAPQVKRAGGHRIGIICEQAKAHRLSGFEELWGFPLVHLLLEMGFSVSIALVPDTDSGDDLQPLIRPWKTEGADVDIVETEDSLNGWLARTDVEAIFSEYFFDERLVHTGHAPFSLRVFEKGWQGAERTLNRLLDRCTIGCFRQMGN